MSNLIRHRGGAPHRPTPEPATLEERLRAHLQQRFGRRSTNAQQCLLLDVSGSMLNGAGTGNSRIYELRQLARRFPGTRRFIFSFADDCRELAPEEDVPDAGGGTQLAEALDYIKAHGILHAALISDGRPDNQAAALRSAAGLRLDIFYVGPPPEPEFLRQLAQATGGSYGTASFTRTAELESRIKGLLTGGG